MISSAELTVHNDDGRTVSVNLEPCHLEAIKHVLNLSFEFDSPTEGDYSLELEAQDPYFTREEQAELRRRIADMDAGRNTTRFNREEYRAELKNV